MFLRVMLLTVIALAVAGAGWCLAETGDIRTAQASISANAADAPTKEKGRGGKNPIAMTPEREAAAITFVTRHHPDLAQLLKHLKESNPREYQRAIRELYKTSENLALTQETDLRRYELDLKSWQLKSRIQLLAARLSMSKSKSLEAELRKVLAEQLDVRIQQQELQRERMSAKVQEAEANITRMTQDRDGEIERSLERLLGDARHPVGRNSGEAKKPSPAVSAASSDVFKSDSPGSKKAAESKKDK